MNVLRAYLGVIHTADYTSIHRRPAVAITKGRLCFVRWADAVFFARTWTSLRPPRIYHLIKIRHGTNTMNRTLAIFLSSLLAGCSLFASDDKPSEMSDGGLGGECTTAEQCSGSLLCAGGSCQLAGSVGIGGSCFSTRDCGDELFCAPQGICAPSGEGGEGDACGTAAECERGLVCEVFGFGGICASAGNGVLGGSCTKNSECAAGLVCGPQDSCGHPTVEYPPFTGVICQDDEESFKAYFENPQVGTLSDFYRLPFPNDLRVSDSGVLDISDFPRPGQGPLGVDIVDLYADALEADFAGFSATAIVSLRFSKELDFGSIDNSGDQLHYIDITPGAPEFGQDRQRGWGYGTGKTLYHCQHYLTISHPPHQPLLSGHTYAVYLTTDITAADGSAVERDTDFEIVMANTRPSEPDDARAWDVYTPFRDYLVDPGVNIDPGTIAVATVFTVQDTTGRGLRLSQAVEASTAPELKDLTLCDGVASSPCEDANGRGACSPVNAEFFEIHGRYTVPIYQEGTAPYETPDDGGGIVEVGGVPQQTGTQDVCFALTVPKTTMPAQGWPLTVYGHGTSGSFTGAVQSGTASQLATLAAPSAMFSFDGVVHGERRFGSSRDSQSLMFNVVNPRAARDNNLQGAADVVQALRIPGIGEQNLPGALATRFDAGNTFFFGHSQGSNVGVPAIATSDLAQAAIFSGAGAHLTNGILTKTSPVDAKAGLEFLLGEPLSTGHPVMVLWQTYFDSVDTLHYAKHLLKSPPAGLSSKHVYMSWGENDSFSPQPTLASMARSTGLPVADTLIEDLSTGTAARPVSGNVVGGDGVARTAACFQYTSDGFDGHFAAQRNPQAIADWTAFLDSVITTGTPTVP